MHVLHIPITSSVKMKVERYFLLLFSLFFVMPSAAETSGSAAEINRLASRYESAQGVERNYPKAFQLYCISAALGNVEANYNLGWMHFNGRGLKSNHPVAVGWFKRAAGLGDTYATNMLDRLGNIPAEKDSACPIPQQSRKLNKKQIETWVRIISASQEIDPALVLAVIQTESAFKIKAHSAKNAQGLMQLIPKTAQRFGVNNSWDPIENILGGVTYIRWLMQHFEGNVKFVLAAYNAGEGAVKRYKGIPPYHETQQYVNKIMARYKREKHPIPPV